MPIGEADDGRGNRQRDGVADRAHDLGKHGTPAGDGIAEIAMQRAHQPQAELHRQRAVKTVGGAELCGKLLRRIGRQHRDERIARRDVHKQKAHQRDADDDRDDIDDASGDIGEHVGFFLPFSPCGRRWHRPPQAVFLRRRRSRASATAPDEGLFPRMILR
ncbi:hypothetical protein ACVWWP_008048 [Bradyrhizobium sp. LM3.6]